ncbi:hypothetical protein I7I51_07107 [Histoplasma capsulatum]|uniref:FAD/NAD(P)-binding domain-containing protein n=1 Tax=Ajellomyces capsulatus TaxID=5037 RepID=A0A8A1MM55_AJECA|nr:predicted protein [Histoplasma mississippiense (nom. inval.)]EDN10068.1 predicted protein [Histoplasma mississippiense (nom. inval.)]QSS66250.1 hypothetical protein I7I51_07107 [Histoplasma capsulatum]
MAIIPSFGSLLILLCVLTLAAATNVPLADYDVIIVGGGPAGLSALSSLSRVRRTALMVDSGEYRNLLTRRIHDVIGNDGVVPSLFRHQARELIKRYPTPEIKNGTVLEIIPVRNSSDELPHFEVEIDMGSEGKPSLVTKTARKIILATGIEDILPDTPGISEAWSRGIYWCPWCDGFEHRDQPLGILGDVASIFDNVMHITTINHDVIAFTNGTQLPANEADEFEKFYGIKHNYSPIKNITRAQDGADHFDDGSQSEFDMFTVHFEGDAPPVNRSVFFTAFASRQRSDLPYKLGLKMVNGKIDNNFKGMATSMSGVYAVGDCNNDDSTNVVHAMFSGKRAAIEIHLLLERENATAMGMTLSQRSQPMTIRELEERADGKIGNEFESLWQARTGY